MISSYYNDAETIKVALTYIKRLTGLKFVPKPVTNYCDPIYLSIIQFKADHDGINVPQMISKITKVLRHWNNQAIVFEEFVNSSGHQTRWDFGNRHVLVTVRPDRREFKIAVMQTKGSPK